MLGTSFKQTLNNQLKDSVQADWLVCTGTCNTDIGGLTTQLGAFSQEAAQIMSELPELESVRVFPIPLRRRADHRRRTAQDHPPPHSTSFSSHVDPGVVAGRPGGSRFWAKCW